MPKYYSYVYEIRQPKDLSHIIGGPSDVVEAHDTWHLQFSTIHAT